MATSKKSPIATIAPNPTADKAADKAAKLTLLTAKLMGNTPKPQISTAPAEKPFITPKATWEGSISFGSLLIPVRTFKATEIEKVAFNQIHHCNAGDDTTPVYTQLKQGKMKCPTCDMDVESSEILKGFKYADDNFVVISEAEKKACMVTSDKLMAVGSFVKSTEIDPIYFESTEYLVSDSELLAAFRKAMVDTGMVALAKSAQKGREQTVVIRPYGTNGMVVSYMFFDNEVRICDRWHTVAENDKDVAVAKDIIAFLADTFDPTEAEDSYTRHLKGFINDRIEGRVTTAPPPQVAAPATTDLMETLKALLALPPKVKKSKAAVAA